MHRTTHHTQTMTQQHPITPPLELYGQWYDESPDDDDLGLVEYVATQAANWGYQQAIEELETFLRNQQ